MSRLLPKLGDPYGLDVIEALRASTSPESLVRIHHPEQTFPPTGGNPAAPADLEAIRDAVVEVAGGYGFPHTPLGTTAPFDRDCAVALHAALEITPHSAASREMWTFLTCCLLPDVSAWRFRNMATERFLGDINRNVFRRLWWRVELLGLPPELPDAVWSREDVLVNVMERPGLSGDRTVAREICTVFRDAVEERKEAEYQGLMRDFMRRVMRRSAFISLTLLHGDQLHGLLVGLMNDTIAVADGGEAAPLQPGLPMDEEVPGTAGIDDAFLTEPESEHRSAVSTEFDPSESSVSPALRRLPRRRI